MPEVPILRGGRPYESLSTLPLTDLRNGEEIGRMSVANPGLIARDLQSASTQRQALEQLSVDELMAICRRAAHLFVHADLPIGDEMQSPEEYLSQLAATTGMPVAMGRHNMEKIRFVLAEMPTVLAGLTRNLDPKVLDRGWGLEGGRCVSYRRETDTLGVVLPSNSPGVHSLWIPSIPLKVPLVLKPGRQEPWSPLRIAQALIAAGCPPEGLSFYPTDYAGAGEILLRCGRSMLFGDRSTVEPWMADPRIQIHGPGWSKIVLDRAAADQWCDHLELMVSSVADNGGRSCINASGIRTAANGRTLAEALAARLATIEARPLNDPLASLAAFPNLAAAHRLSSYIDSQLRIPGAIDLTAQLRPQGRVAEADGCAFMLPTVVYCEDARHPLASAEFLFPFVSIVEVPEEELLISLGPTLVGTVLSDDPQFQAAAMGSTLIERLNLGPIPTSRVSWDQPHEGNLFEHLFRQRALQSPELVA